jgi:DNA-binding MarR family transcriptional regulator
LLEGDQVDEPQSLENEIVSSIRRIMRAVEVHSRQLVREYGLTGPQLTVLRVVEELETATVTAVARRVFLSRPTVTRILDRLAVRGMVEREPHESDRRRIVVKPTPLARRTLEKAPSLLQERFRRELTQLEEWEQTAILASMQRIAAMMDVESVPAEPMLVPGDVAAEEERSNTVEDAGDGPTTAGPRESNWESTDSTRNVSPAARESDPKTGGKQ